MRDPCHWARSHASTFNPYWKEQGLQPNEPFPDLPYIPDLFAVLQAEPVVLIEKSRDLMASWVCVAYLLWEAMREPYRLQIFQTLTLPKVVELVNYAKQLYRSQPKWLQEACPPSKPIERQTDQGLEFANGSKILGIPGGKGDAGNKIRLYHPWGYLLDEAAFVSDAGECYDAVLAAGTQKMIFNSSAGPGWYADFKNDSILNIEA